MTGPTTPAAHGVQLLGDTVRLLVGERTPTSSSG